MSFEGRTDLLQLIDIAVDGALLPKNALFAPALPPGLFHPITAAWFVERFCRPTAPQELGWPAIAAGRNTLIAAPTGSGKTLTAFLFFIDRLMRQAAGGTLLDQTQVLYISPLKALSNDIRRNLESPLAELSAQFASAVGDAPPIRTAVRTGDTPAKDRQAMVRRPPHILVTTPESLYLLLTSASGRTILQTVRSVIVDEIHALARDKRGSHLALSLERLEALCPRPPVRIGLSATQRPVEEMARFLVGSRRVDAAGRADCHIVDVGHFRDLDLGIIVPPSELSTVCTHELWAEIYEELCREISNHRSTVVFVNTRRLAERVGFQLGQRLGADKVASHHGSLARELRLDAETKLKTGELKAIVATASLELGIDVGFIELVCQIGSPRSIATFLQRIGRSGHSLGAVPKGRLFPLSRDELLECMALVRAVRNGRLDPIEPPVGPLDILAQQMVAAASVDDWQEDALYDLCRAAWPFRGLTRQDFDAVLQILSEGIAPSVRRGAYLHRDRIQRRVRGRRGARLAAVTNGGAIPETGDFRVVVEADQTFVGTVNEDFAIESQGGDVFLLGNASWRIHRVRGNEVLVEDAHGAPASVPFWLGEGPGRTVELSAELSNLRHQIAEQLQTQADLSTLVNATEVPATHPTVASLIADCGAGEWGARQAVAYLAAQLHAVGWVPTQTQIVFERFFDESGGMQLVIHAPLGSRINRAWGLALRKRFCRTFDFELQAAADDNGIVLSLGPQHSFAIEQLFGMLRPGNAESILVQALLAAPMFPIRWRWNVTRALAVLRQRGGKKVPPQLQRFHADDLLAAVFPEKAGCFENHSGDLPIPDHPLVRQTLHDCLHEAMDLDRWVNVLTDVEEGRVTLVGCDTREPSPFSYSLLNSNVYTFLDDAPLEERRARAVATRRSLADGELHELARLDPEAIEQVCAEAWPTVRDADELHDALLSMAVLPLDERAGDWKAWFGELAAAGRATAIAGSGERIYWVAAERWPVARALWPDARPQPPLALPPELDGECAPEDAIVTLVRGWLEVCGPTSAERIAERFALRVEAVLAALEALEGRGSVLRGRFTTPQAAAVEWCDRRLLARIHRLTLEGARRSVRPATPVEFLRFLVAHQRLGIDQLSGKSGLREIVEQLQGFEAPAGAWERHLLGPRLRDYQPAWLDELSLVGELAWGRLQPPRRDEDAGPASVGIHRAIPITLARRAELSWLLPADGQTRREQLCRFLRSNAQQVYDVLRSQGAQFFDDLVTATGLLPAHVEDSLGELAALGLVSADGFAAIRGVTAKESSLRQRPARRRARRRATQIGGRWSKFPLVAGPAPTDRVEKWAWQLLRRYGIMFRDLLARESAAPPWHELAVVYRRLEARGEIRGGRFVANVAGEQFALADAAGRLRQLRETEPTGALVTISAADPVNLIGVIVPGPRIPPAHKSTITLRDGHLRGHL